MVVEWCVVGGDHFIFLHSFKESEVKISQRQLSRSVVVVAKHVGRWIIAIAVIAVMIVLVAAGAIVLIIEVMTVIE